MNNFPIYNITLEGESNGVFAVSLVDRPAVDSMFLTLSEQETIQLMKTDEEQHIVYGCILRADYPIYRHNEQFGDHYIIFSKETIKQIAERFMKDQNGQNVDLNHDFKYIDNVYLTQLFVKDIKAGINPVGFEDIADGSLFGQYKIEDEKVWEDIKLGKFKGFSIEGNFQQELMMNKEEKKDSFNDWIENIIRQK